ncbi:hypothetical protein [Thorsellia anophelis]|uniref:Lipoprotein n=1 Tax=Thorsellia anophelis DSM 18579 TaxID=1123402 RepID=A0A1H9ZRD5_9GAMM|nr:hypothetical protein [Thorsellia anophelis]SES84272.1 hypothetical protein SAMN02583745_00662 [Thorsellia anophelis DSM 18579]
MAYKLKRIITSIMVSTVFILTGCAGGGGGYFGSSSSVDPRLKNNPDIEFFSRSGLTACAAGAGLGIAGCLLSNSSKKAECALIAAVAGCGVGIGANAYLDYNRKKYGSEEEALNSAISDMKVENNRLERINQINKQVIIDNKATLDKLSKEIANNTINADMAEKQLKSIDANINFLRDTLAKAKERQANWEKVSNSTSADSSELDEQIAQMNEKVQALESELDSLFTQRSAIKLS